MNALRKTTLRLNAAFSRGKLIVLLNLVAQVVRQIGAFITFPLLARYLGAEGYGVQVQMNSFVGVLTPIASLGLGFSVVRLVAGSTDKDYVSQRFASTVLLVTVVASIFAAVQYAAAPLLNDLFIRVDWAVDIIRLSSLLIVVGAVSTIVQDYYRARVRLLYTLLLQIVLTLAQIGGMVLILTNGGGLREIVLLNIVSSVAVILAWVILFYRLGEVRLRAGWMSRADLRAMVTSGFPVVVMGLSSWVMIFGDRAVIGYYLPVSEVGIYGAAYTLAMIIGALLGGPFWNLLYPLMSTHKNRGDLPSLYLACRRFMNSFLVLSIPAVVGLTVLSNDLLRIFGSESFHIAPLAFGLIALAVFMDNFSTNAHYLVYLHDQPSFMRDLTIIAGTANILLNLILVPQFGILGAAISTVGAYALLDVLLFRRILQYGYALRQLYDFNWIRQVLIASTGMGIALVLIRQVWIGDSVVYLLALIGIGVAVYGATLLLVYRANTARLLAALSGVRA